MKITFRFLFILTLLNLATSHEAAFAQSDSARFSYTLLRTAEKINADGVLSEKAWSDAESITGFMQTEPVPGAASSSSTVVKLLYDDNYLYVGVQLSDPAPGKIIATAMERDSDVEDDDAITIIIDSYNDNLNGIGFATNPLGARLDFEISQNGQALNYSFNTFWNVVCNVTNEGWTAEFIIPFSSLRFQEKEQVVMGFKAIRLLKRNNEYSVFPPHSPDIADPYYRLDLTADIVFSKLQSKKPLYISPFVTADIVQNQVLDTSANRYKPEFAAISQKNYIDNDTPDRLLSNIGLDVKAGLSKNFTLDLTMNTDFAQAEVDDRILNITRYNVFFPEKRAFFLEAQDYFNFNMGVTRVFNSRSIGIEQGKIVPIIAGARLTGQAGGYQVGLMNMQTHEVEEAGIEAQNFSVFRLKKDLYKNGSYLGGIITNRISTSNSSVSNQAAGLDYLHRLNNRWFLQTAAATSAGHFNLKRMSLSDAGSQFRLVKFSTRGFSHVLDVSYAGPAFNPGIGFLRYQSLIWTTFNNGYAWITENHKSIANLKLENTFQYAYNPSTESPEFVNIALAPVVQWKNGAAMKLTMLEYYRDTFGFSWYLSDDILVPGGDYHQYYSTLYFVSPGNQQYRGDLWGKYGDFYGGRMINAFVGGRYNVSKHLKLGVRYEFTRIQFPENFSTSSDDPLYLTNLFSFNFSVNFSARTSIKALVQYDDFSDSFGSNIRFRYNPREGTDLYIVLNQNINTLRTPLVPGAPELPAIQGQALMLKFIRTFDAKSRK